MPDDHPQERLEREMLVRWLGGDDDAGRDLLAARVPDLSEQSLISRSIDPPAANDADPAAHERNREAAQQRLWEQFLPPVDAGVLAQLRTSGRLVTALHQALDGDEALRRRWAAGNKGAGKRLHQRYHARLRRFVESMVNDPDTAADLTNATFLDLTKQIKQVRDFKSYMYAIARNKVNEWFKRHFNRPIDVDVDGISSIADSVEQRPEHAVGRKVERKQLFLALQSLPLEQQMTLVLYMWDDMPASEIAAIFGIKEAGVRGRIRLGKSGIGRFLAETKQRAADADTTALEAWFAALQEKVRSRLDEGDD